MVKRREEFRKLPKELWNQSGVLQMVAVCVEKNVIKLAVEGEILKIIIKSKKEFNLMMLDTIN